MKKFLLLLLTAIATAAMTARAQSQLWLDYCSGQYNTTQRAIAEVGDIEVAIHLTSDQLAGLGGNEVSQLAMAFPSTHPTSMTMWIRTDPNGENLREIEVTKIVSKWNVYDLESPLPLTGKEDALWIGATFTQKYASNKFISMAGTSNYEGCYYRVNGGEWQNKASEDVGSLCIRAGVTGDNIPQHNMSISRISAPELTYGIGDVIPFTARITNHGADNVVNPIIRCSINNNVVTDVTVAADIPCSEYADVTIKVPTASVANPGIATFSFEALWADGEADTHPENNTDAMNVGLVIAHHDLALENVRLQNGLVKVGSNITVTGTIRNNNYVAAQNPYIIYTLNGGTETKKSISCNLKNGESADFSFNISTRAFTEDCDVIIDLQLAWRDGSADDNPADNVAQLKAKLTSKAPNRRMVVEEGTGTWCGWCVRGIVGLHDMAAKYPDRFIGIAVHNNDEMANATYNSLLTDLGISGYPGCFINRATGHTDPSFSKLESYYKSMPEYCDIDVEADALLSDKEFVMKAHVTPLVDIEGADYRIAFAVTEDHISGVQSNYYAGGGSGVMGGYEKLGSSVKVDFMDVARGIWPGTRGSSATALPSSMTGGETYTVEHAVAASQVTHKSLDNCNVIVLVLDNATGEIVNAARFEQRLVGIHSVLAPDTTNAPAYNVTGKRVNAHAHGIVIKDGRKTIK